MGQWSKQIISAQERNLDVTVQTLWKPVVKRILFSHLWSIVTLPNSWHLPQRKTNVKHYHISLSLWNFTFCIFVLVSGRDQTRFKMHTCTQTRTQTHTQIHAYTHTHSYMTFSGSDSDRSLSFIPWAGSLRSLLCVETSLASYIVLTLCHRHPSQSRSYFSRGWGSCRLQFITCYLSKYQVCLCNFTLRDVEYGNVFL